MKTITTMLLMVTFATTNCNAQLSVPCGEQSIYWSDDFESPIPNWSATNGVWQTGVPTSGPGTAHGGTNCAATILDGNYPFQANSILKNNVPITIPSAALNPRLRFWSYYSFATEYGTDYGRVQIKTSSSSWIDLSPFNYTTNGSGVWSLKEIDLTAYGDSTVQIGFLIQDQLSCNCPPNQSAGWYIDDIEIITGPSVHFNPEGFENNWGDWSAEGTWQIGIPLAGPASGCTGSPSCAGTNLSSNYGFQSRGHLKSPWMILQANPSISFCHWFSFSTTYGTDVGRLEIRTGNSGWQTVETFDGSSPVWTNAFYDLSAYSNDTVQLGFYFQDNLSCVCPPSQSSGWYVDNVYIAGLADTSCFYQGGIDCNLVPGGSALPGTACDDGDSWTSNDTLDADCNCNGTLTVGLDPKSTGESWSFYPNPMTSYLTIEFPAKHGLSHLVISDLLGREIDIIAIERQQRVFWGGGELGAGVYLIKAVGINGEISTKKFVKS